MTGFGPCFRLFTFSAVLAFSAAAVADTTGRYAAFTPSRYIDHIKILASDAFEGRGTGAHGNDLASEYISKHFAEYGLQPMGTDGWFQPFDVHSRKVLVEDHALFEVKGMDNKWKIRQDWITFPMSAMDGADGALEAPLAFCGFGIAADEFNYDDYTHFNVEGKAVIVFRYEPKGDDPDAKFGGKTASAHSTFVRKCRVAADRGAVALIIVNPPDRDDSNTDDLYTFDPGNTRTTYRLPLIQIKRDVADAILAKAGAPSLSELHAECQAGNQASRDLNLTMRLKTGLEYLKARNVIGYLPGDGSTDEIIVVGAHYDHEGIKPPGFYNAEGPPAIHNGADDNASGTAGLLELARTLASGPKLRRNLLFITFAGEEMGLLGSRHFVEHPTVSLDRVRAMLNFDMIGRYGQHRFELWGTTTADEFPELTARVGERLGVEFKTPQSKSIDELFGRSDHAPFFEAGIPVMFPFTGLHREYHRPEDDWELIDADGAVHVLDFVREILVELASMREGPTYRGPEEKPAEENAVASASADQAADASKDAEPEQDPPSRTGGRARIGFAPTYDDTRDGVLIDTVTADTAIKAGLRDGDRLLRIDDIDIAGLRDYMNAMSGREPGQVVKLLIERDGKELTLEVPLTK
ncbi:MAG: M28 family peptidase [Phycisphaerales bacterium]|nr:M28 family peptidase [Phycisphaerales bacterium]